MCNIKNDEKSNYYIQCNIPTFWKSYIFKFTLLHHHDIESCNHSHDEKTFKYEECLDCITFDNNNDFNFINNELITFSKFIHSLILDQESFTENNFNKNYSSRAPPIS